MELLLLTLYADTLWEEGIKLREVHGEEDGEENRERDMEQESQEDLWLYRCLIRYVEAGIWEEEEKAKLYPKLVLKLSEKLNEIGRTEQLEKEYSVRIDLFCGFPECAWSGRGMLLGDQIMALRKQKGWTQSKLSEEILDYRNLLQIEKNRQAPMPANYKEIMKRLGREAGRFYPFIKTDRIALHRIRRQGCTAYGRSGL